MGRAHRRGFRNEIGFEQARRDYTEGIKGERFLVDEPAEVSRIHFFYAKPPSRVSQL